ncbi:hypothetical protein [Acidovorax sp. RAC01]|uniref:hypothetical protein n=1 Tax=Acidovorax sp. RAC01 TaxID=1842533 RepID=UPI00083E87E3|nr:hypothetical protein [Acidovorax sp. RAC01]AOG23129.1 hypothetical protein BSY15_3852 [Acidovorax sp. RAC01]AOG24343.1 hypothetical protein BSY15_3774 [Acidovorax sp. RAC01]
MHIPGPVDRAIPIHRYRKPLTKRLFYALARWGWLLLFLLVLVLTGCSGDMRHEYAEAQELLAIQQEEAAQASRDFVARQVCGEARAQWISDKTLYCEPRRGKAYKASVQLP